MNKYVHCVLLAGFLAAGCKHAASPNAADGSDDRSGSARSDTIEIPARTQFHVRVDKTVDSAKAKQGELVKGILETPIVAAGRELLPRGTDVDLRVTNSQLASAPGSVGLLTLDVEIFHHRGGEYTVKAAPVTVQTAPVREQVNPGKLLPNLPLTEKEGRANAVLRPDQALLFETLAPVFVKP